MGVVLALVLELDVADALELELAVAEPVGLVRPRDGGSLSVVGSASTAHGFGV